ncbi:MAG: DUF4440 domain-containing protein [Beijerinckiaceae bacterium]
MDASQLQRLEESLWRAETRFDPDYMDKVLAADFFEFGRSGRRWTRTEIIDAGNPREIRVKLPFDQFNIHMLDNANALVTYVSDVMNEEHERSNRSSLWTWTSFGWKLRFHQGTPAA